MVYWQINIHAPYILLPPQCPPFCTMVIFYFLLHQFLFVHIIFVVYVSIRNVLYFYRKCYHLYHLLLLLCLLMKKQNAFYTVFYTIIYSNLPSLVEEIGTRVLMKYSIHTYIPVINAIRVIMILEMVMLPSIAYKMAEITHTCCIIIYHCVGFAIFLVTW